MASHPFSDLMWKHRKLRDVDGRTSIDDHVCMDSTVQVYVPSHCLGEAFILGFLSEAFQYFAHSELLAEEVTTSSSEKG